jgi:hypothetical protein
MSKHRLTKVQKQVLRWMANAEGQIRILTGYKNTFPSVDSYEPVICCQSLVPYFLKHHGYIEQASGISTYRLTKKGKVAAA